MCDNRENSSTVKLLLTLNYPTKGNDMKMKITAFSLTLLLVSASFTSYADTLFRPRVSLGYTSYELAFTGSGNSLADSTYLAGGFGATIAADNLYFDIAYTTSLGATYDNGGIDDDFERTDLNLTLGVVFEGGFTLFGGYKIGKSEYSDTVSTATLLTFEATGPYFGVGMSTSLPDGSFSFNIALAFLKGELTDNDTFFVPYDAEADTIGFSMGAGYTHFLGNDSGIALKGALQFYSFVDWVDANATIDDTDETVISVDISYFANF